MVKRILAFPLFAAALLGAGCVAFNVGEPQRWTIDRGEKGEVVVTRQKKMSLGFFPAEAEHIWKPAGAIQPRIGWNHKGDGYYWKSNSEVLGRYLIGTWFATPWSILVTPWHGEYSCSAHHWTGQNIEWLRALPAGAQAELGVKTWRDGSWRFGYFDVGHSSLLGCHRFETVIIEEKDGDDNEDGDDASKD